MPQSKETSMTDPRDQQTSQQDVQLLAEDLIEEVSIDGMCGVY